MKNNPESEDKEVNYILPPNNQRVHEAMVLLQYYFESRDNVDAPIFLCIQKRMIFLACKKTKNSFNHH